MTLRETEPINKAIAIMTEFSKINEQNLYKKYSGKREVQ